MADNRIYNFYKGSQHVEHIENQVNNYNYYGDQAPSEEVLAGAAADDAVALPVPPEVWERLREEGVVDEDNLPVGSNTEKVVLAHVLGSLYGIDGWAPFERAWRIPHLRTYWQRALGFTKTDKLLSQYRNILDR